jgi:transposase
VFTWRRQARRLPTPVADDPPFVPAVLGAMAPAVAVGHERKTAQRKAKPDVGGIEIEAEGVTIRVGRGADVAMIAAIVHALKARR